MYSYLMYNNHVKNITLDMCTELMASKFVTPTYATITLQWLGIGAVLAFSLNLVELLLIKVMNRSPQLQIL